MDLADQIECGGEVTLQPGGKEVFPFRCVAIETYPILGFVVAGVLASVWGSVLGYAVVVGLALLFPLTRP